MVKRPSRQAQVKHRSDRVHRRLLELRALLDRLRSGEPITEADLSVAERRARESARLADLAHRNAALAHTRAAEAHRAAARAAAFGGHEEMARLHENAAAVDDAGASLDMNVLRLRRPEVGSHGPQVPPGAAHG